MSASNDEDVEVYPEGRVSGHVYRLNDPTTYQAVNVDTEFSDEAWMFFQMDESTDGFQATITHNEIVAELEGESSDE